MSWMAEDTQDQGAQSALRPRPGWDKAARNPDIVHGPIDPAAVPSSGYSSTYQPPKGPSPPHSEDAGELDQTPFTAEQQGHKLGRSKGGPAAVGATGGRDSSPLPDIPSPAADGRPGWDGRFHLERAAWEMAPRTVLLRPPSPSSSLPSVSPNGGGRRRSVDGPGFGFGDTAAQGGRRRSVGADGYLVGAEGSGLSNTGAGGGAGAGAGANGGTDAFGARATVLPGLNATSPALRTSPYFFAPGVPLSPGRDTGATQAYSGAPRPAGAKRQSVDLADTYVGRAYSPDEQQQKRVSGLGGGPSPDGAAATGRRESSGNANADGAEADDEGGVDGHGTHLPALDRAYFGRPAAEAKKEAETSAAKRAAAKAAAASQRRSEQHSKLDALGAVYMPANRRRAASRQGSKKELHAPASAPAVSARLYPGPAAFGGGGRRESVGADGADVGDGGGGVTPRNRDTGIGGPWKPSGRQPIPGDVPAVAHASQRLTASEQAEADRRRSQPRDPALYSPERYPLVGQGWFMPPEKFPPNPAYAGVRAKYMETKRPQSDPEGEADKQATGLHMPDIHTKPWLTPGKHLVTDSSAPPQKMTGTAGARPAYGFSPSATATSAHSTLRSNKGTARAKAGSKGGGRGKGRSKDGAGGEGYSGSDSDSGGEPEGDREVLAVIGGVRLMSMIRRQNMADEARLEADEDAQFQAEDGAEEGGQDAPARDADGDEPAQAKKQQKATAGAAEEEGPDDDNERDGSAQEEEREGTFPGREAAAGDERDVASSYSVQRSSSGPRGERSFEDAGEVAGAAAGGGAAAPGPRQAAKADADEDEGVGEEEGKEEGEEEQQEEEEEGEGAEAGAGEAAAAADDEQEEQEGNGEEDAEVEAGEAGDADADEEQEGNGDDDVDGAGGEEEDDEGLAAVGIGADSDAEEQQEGGDDGNGEEGEDGDAPASPFADAASEAGEAHKGDSASWE